MSPDPSQAEAAAARLVFACPGCGLRLSAAPEQAGIRGPCPSCGGEVTAPSAPVPLPSAAVAIDVIPPEFSRREGVSGRVRRSPGRQRRGMIVADSVVDRGHLEHREMMKSLFVIVAFIVALGACLAATWFFRDWVGK